MDNLTGTVGSDTFIADNTGTNLVTSAADTVNGGAGNDTLKVYVKGGDSIGVVGAGTTEVLPGTITGIENLNINGATNAGKTLDVSGIAGLTSVTLDSFASGGTVNLAGQSLTIANSTGANAYVVSSSSDTAENITVSKVGTSAANTVDVSGTKVTSIAIGSTGTLPANTSNTVTLTDTGLKADTVTVSGASALNLKLGTGTTGTTYFASTGIKTIDASAATGNVAITVASGGAAGEAELAATATIKGGAGNDTIDLSTATIGAAAINTATAFNKLAIDGGAGNDTVIINNTLATQASAITSLTNVETLGVNLASGSINAANFGSSVTGIKLVGTDAGGVTINNLASAGTFDEGTSTQGANAVVVNAAGTGTTDTLAWTLGSATTAFNGGVAATGTNTINGYETVTLTSQGAANGIGATTLNASAGGNETLNLTLTKDLAFGSTLTLSGVSTAINVSGSGALSVSGVITAGSLTDTGTGAVTATAANKVLNADFSAVTGAVSFNDSGATAGAILKGGAGNTTFTGGSYNDVITVGGGSNIITGGLGADIITISHSSVANVDTLMYTALSGTNDSGAAITANGALTGVDVITGLQKGDVLNLGAAAGSLTNALAGSWTGNVAAGTAAVQDVRGTYNSSTGAFTADANGHDSLIQWADATAGHGTAAIVLVGYAGATGSSLSANGVLTLG